MYFAFYTNSQKYQPNLYGDKMVSKYANIFDTFGINHKTLIYQLQQNVAESEETFLGLGLADENKKVWFDYVSEKPILETHSNPENVHFKVQIEL